MVLIADNLYFDFKKMIAFRLIIHSLGQGMIEKVSDLRMGPRDAVGEVSAL